MAKIFDLVKVEPTETGTEVLWKVGEVEVRIGGASRAGHGGRVAALRNAAANLRKMGERCAQQADRETRRKRSR